METFKDGVQSLDEISPGKSFIEDFFRYTS